MKITATTLLLTFLGLLHFDCAVSADVVEVHMSNNHSVGGALSPTNVEPYWMRPLRYPPDFQGYEVFIRTCIGFNFASGHLKPRVTIPRHNPAQEVPASVEVNLWTNIELINDGEFQRYIPAAPPKYHIFKDYLFITRKRTKDIYWVTLKLKPN